MDKLKKLVDKSPQLQSARAQYLNIKDAGGPIRVKLVGCENAKNREYETGREIQGVHLLFEQNGLSKKYFVPTLGKDGKFHYLIERFAEIEEGAELVLEFKRKKGSVQGFIDVRFADEGEQVKVDSKGVIDDDIPVINEDEVAQEDIGGELGIEEES